MKNCLLLLPLAFIFSCSGNEASQNEDPVLPEKDTSMALVADTIPKKEAKEEPSSKKVSIEDFPKKWYVLTPNEDGYMIFHDCEAEDQQIWIEKNENNGWEITVVYGQDSQEFKLVSFEAEEEEVELMQVVSGQFIIENPRYPDADPEIYDFMWNKDEQFGRFEGFFNEPAMMVDEAHKSEYPEKSENCDYLNDM